ncbi:MAG: hypothetical protein V7637_1188 [Mycobacteriales bacterium]|jgi:hypothetical protein
MAAEQPGRAESGRPAWADATPSRSVPEAGRAGVDVPAGTPGLDEFVGLVRRRADVTELVSHLLGRPVRPRVLGQQVIQRVRPPGLLRLATTGPVLHRHLRLDDSLPPYLPVAVLWTLIVPWRLPAAVQVGLLGPRPLDQLLGLHGLPWTSEPEETQVHPAAEASTDFRWAPPGAPLVEQSRLLVAADGPVATTVEEIPLLRGRSDPAAPLLPWRLR